MGVIMNRGLFLSQDIHKRVCTGCFVMRKEQWQRQGSPLVVTDGGLQAGSPSTLSFHILPPPQVSWEQNSAAQVKGQPNRCSVAGSEKAEVNPAEATKHRKSPRPADTKAEASTGFHQGSRQTSSILCPVPRAGQQQQQRGFCWKNLPCGWVFPYALFLAVYSQGWVLCLPEILQGTDNL